MATYERRSALRRIHRRIRKKVSGTGERPRLVVNFSGRHVSAQIIDDERGATVASVHTTSKDFRAGQKVARANCDTAEQVGKLIAERGLKAKVEKVVFDRGGYQYHGKVKALAEAARSGGLQF